MPRGLGEFFFNENHSIWGCTPKLDRKSNFWGAFIKKLTYEDKVQIYELRKQGFSFQQLSDMYGINKASLKYMVRLIDRYGLEIVKKGEIIITLQH